MNADAVYGGANGGTYLPTDLSTEENMNIGARCDYAGDGTYVLMAKRASSDTMQKVSNIQYTNPTWKDGIVNMTFTDTNSNTKYYNIYYSKNHPFTSLDEEGVTMEKYNAGLDYYPVNIGGYQTDAYVSVVAVADNGAKSEPSDIAKVNTGVADRDGDGIPDWYCDQYLLWPESGVERDIANSDKDKDGFTNLEEYTNGSDPSDPNDPVQNIAVESISLDQKNVTLKPGATAVLTVGILPANAANKNVEWRVDDSTKATIEPNGLNCKITAISEGTATVTVTAADGGYMSTANITITNKAGTQKPHKREQNINISHGSSGQKLKRKIGSKLTQKVTGAKTAVTFESSNPKVARVGKTSGIISFVGIGKAIITTKAAESDEYKAASKKTTIYVIPKTAGIKSVKSNTTGQVTIKSNNTANGNDGYQIQYKHNGKTGKVTVKGTKSVTRTFKNLKSGTKFKVRIRAYKKADGRTYYGKYSKWKKLKKVK